MKHIAAGDQQVPVPRMVQAEYTDDGWVITTERGRRLFGEADATWLSLFRAEWLDPEFAIAGNC